MSDFLPLLERVFACRPREGDHRVDQVEGKIPPFFTFSAHPRIDQRSGEPVFLPDPQSDRGAVICQYFDSRKVESGFLVFDSENVSAGPRACMTLKSPIPPLFHATFEPEHVAA